MKEYKFALVGATGLVGRTAIKVMEEMNLPFSKITFFASSRSAGSTIIFNNKEYIVQELTDTSFDDGYDFAVFSAGGETSKHFSPIAASKGCVVVDNSSAFRMDPDVPLVVPEVNPEDIKKHHGIIANPNCSTIQAMVPLKVMDDLYQIKRIIYSTYQACSGAGQKGLEDLRNGLNGEPPKKFPHPIVNNCLPHIDVFVEDGYTKEEHKMINETRKILHRPDLKVTATCVRVPVENSHSESINVEFEKDFEMDDLIQALSKAEGIKVVDDVNNDIYPLATNATGQDDVYVGRIRRDDTVKSGINFWDVADNVRKGAASNALQIVKKLIEFDNE